MWEVSRKQQKELAEQIHGVPRPPEVKVHDCNDQHVPHRWPLPWLPRGRRFGRHTTWEESPVSPVVQEVPIVANENRIESPVSQVVQEVPIVANENRIEAGGGHAGEGIDAGTIVEAPRPPECKKCTSQTSTKKYARGPRLGQPMFLKGMCNKCFPVVLTCLNKNPVGLQLKFMKFENIQKKWCSFG